MNDPWAWKGLMRVNVSSLQWLSSPFLIKYPLLTRSCGKGHHFFVPICHLATKSAENVTRKLNSEDGGWPLLLGCSLHASHYAVLSTTICTTNTLDKQGPPNQNHLAQRRYPTPLSSFTPLWTRRKERAAYCSISFLADEIIFRPGPYSQFVAS